MTKRVNDRSSNDLLRNLPLGIVHRIIARVPIRDAIKTSLLSRKWRYYWTSLPELSFTDEIAAAEDENYEENIKEFINRVLLLHKGPIQKFKLDISGVRSWPDTDQWLIVLSRNNVSEIKLAKGLAPCIDYFTVHSSLYSCENLHSLKLEACDLISPPPPSFKGFFRLKLLSLKSVNMPSHLITSLVAKCPVLESFKYVSNQCFDLRITSENLKYVKLSGVCKVHMDAPLLAEMKVIFERSFYTDKRLHRMNSVCNYTDFLGGIVNLENLYGDLLTKYLSIGMEHCQESLVFHKLKCLQLHNVNLGDSKEIAILIRIVASSPNLHKLVISGPASCVDIWEITDSDSSTTNASEARHFRCEHRFEKLREVKMSFVRGLPQELSLMKSLLGGSPLLEKLTISSTYGLSSKEIHELKNELLKFGRASPNAGVWFGHSL